MPEDPINTHPVAEMLENNEPEAAEYWLHDDDVQTIIDDHAAGRIDAATFAAKAAAWKEAWLKKLAAMSPPIKDALLPPNSATASPELASTTPPDTAPPRTTGAIPGHLLPHTARRPRRGPPR